jgi:hypothetical protein
MWFLVILHLPSRLWEILPNPDSLPQLKKQARDAVVRESAAAVASLSSAAATRQQHIDIDAELRGASSGLAILATYWNDLFQILKRSPGDRKPAALLVSKALPLGDIIASLRTLPVAGPGAAGAAIASEMGLS